jgi:hypothetical protein
MNTPFNQYNEVLDYFVIEGYEENTYFATALVRGHSVGVTIRAKNIGKAFELAEDYLQERNPQSEVIVQAVQHINNEFADGKQRIESGLPSFTERTIAAISFPNNDQVC